MSDRKEVLRDLVLMLIYLTSWTEKGFEARRAWKGYDFDLLNELTDAEMIYGSAKAKTVNLTDEGVERAKAIVAKYGLADLE